MSGPTPAERLAERLGPFPRACRDVLEELERARLQGGGVVVLRLEMDVHGKLEASVELVRRYGPRA